MSIALGLLGCGGEVKVDVPPQVPIGTSEVDLTDPETVSLGAFEGPYYFIRALTPSVIRLADLDAKTENFTLIGLRDGEYPPEPKAAKAVPALTPEAAEARQRELFQYKMDALKALCGKNQLWIIRMSDQAPAMIYLYQPLTSQSDPKRLTGSAQLINALALRRGIATMELEGVRHQCFRMMLDCQLKGVIEARGKKGEDLWRRFGLTLPAGIATTRLAEIEKEGN